MPREDQTRRGFLGLLGRLTTAAGAGAAGLLKGLSHTHLGGGEHVTVHSGGGEDTHGISGHGTGDDGHSTGGENEPSRSTRGGRSTTRYYPQHSTQQPPSLKTLRIPSNARLTAKATHALSLQGDLKALRDAANSIPGLNPGQAQVLLFVWAYVETDKTLDPHHVDYGNPTTADDNRDGLFGFLDQRIRSGGLARERIRTTGDAMNAGRAALAAATWFSATVPADERSDVAAIALPYRDEAGRTDSDGHQYAEALQRLVLDGFVAGSGLAKAALSN